MQVSEHLEGLTPANALSLISLYDIVVDASDNAPTRYLLSDACAVARKPLASGAAIGTDGQLTVYCHGQQGDSLASHMGMRAKALFVSQSCRMHLE